MRVEESTIVDRPPEDVFRFFDERSNDPRWMSQVLESEWADPGEETAVGRRGRMVMNAMGARQFDDEVVEYEPDRLVAHRSFSGPMIIYSACRVDPAAGGTRVTMIIHPERLPGGPFGSLIAPIVGWNLKRVTREDLGRLKDLIESD